MAKTKKSQTDNILPSELISKRIKELGDWRGRTLTKIRELIKEALMLVIKSDKPARG